MGLIGFGRGPVGVRGQQAAHKQRPDEGQQQRAEYLAQPLGEGVRLQGDQPGHRKEHQAVRQLPQGQAGAALQRGLGHHFKAGAGGAGNGQPRPDGQIDQQRKHRRKGGVYPGGQPVQVTCPGDGHDPQHREPDGRQTEPGHGRPGVLPGLGRQKRREDQVARAKKQRKHSKDHQQPVMGCAFHEESPPLGRCGRKNGLQM